MLCVGVLFFRYPVLLVGVPVRMVCSLIIRKMASGQASVASLPAVLANEL